MKSYQDLLQDVLDNGRRVPNRTGIDTLSVFGRMFRHDLKKGFPLLTTKKMAWKGVRAELVWLIRGETNVRSLNEQGVHIWDANADEDGELGPVYGHSWRNWGGKIDRIPKVKPRLREGLTATYLGVANGEGKGGHPLGKTWEGMISRCYYRDDIGYADYGARGVRVCNRWLEFKAFAEDAANLPGWDNKAADLRGYCIDKDGRGNGFIYGPEYCQWITPAENQALQHNKRYVVEKDGEIFTFTNIEKFCNAHGADGKNFSDLWTGRKNAKERYGFRLVAVHDRSKGIDQLGEAVRLLREDPDSRRIIVSAWNPNDVPLAALPPCHYAFQFRSLPRGPNVRELSCMVHMRSADLFLGVPLNIASYAALTCLLARMTGHERGELIMTFGDLHLYINHLEQAKEQLSRQPHPLPHLEIPTGVELDTVGIDDFRLFNYNHHPAIKGDMAV